MKTTRKIETTLGSLKQEELGIAEDDALYKFIYKYRSKAYSLKVNL